MLLSRGKQNMSRFAAMLAEDIAVYLTQVFLVNCRVEFLTHDISVHVPHHVASKIPWYNLRMANDSLRKNWGQVRPSAAACLRFQVVSRSLGRSCQECPASQLLHALISL